MFATAKKSEMSPYPLCTGEPYRCRWRAATSSTAGRQPAEKHQPSRRTSNDDEGAVRGQPSATAATTAPSGARFGRVSIGHAREHARAERGQSRPPHRARHGQRPPRHCRDVAHRLHRLELHDRARGQEHGGNGASTWGRPSRGDRVGGQHGQGRERGADQKRTDLASDPAGGGHDQRQAERIAGHEGSRCRAPAGSRAA